MSLLKVELNRVNRVKPLEPIRICENCKEASTSKFCKRCNLLFRAVKKSRKAKRYSCKVCDKVNSKQLCRSCRRHGYIILNGVLTLKGVSGYAQ